MWSLPMLVEMASFRNLDMRELGLISVDEIPMENKGVVISGMKFNPSSGSLSMVVSRWIDLFLVIFPHIKRNAPCSFILMPVRMA